MKLVDPARGVTVNIGGVIPGSVVHHGPPDELRARLVRVAVVIEEIGGSEPAGGDAIASHRPIASELGLIALERLFLGSEAEIVRDVEPGEIGFRSRRGNAGNLAVGEI